MDEMIYNTLSYYFHALEVKGYMPFRDSVKALLLIFYRDFVFNDFRARITEEDYHLIEKALDCLYGTTCLIPYPDYLKMGKLYLDETTELGARIKNVEDTPVVKLLHDIANAEGDVGTDIMVTTDGFVGDKDSNSDYDTEWSDVQGGSGNVNSVNGKTGDVILNANDVGALPANTEYQSPINDLESIRSGAQSGATAYQKPNTGIPSTDLSSAVQVSLRKADSALQTETDPTVPSWAKQSSKPTYTAQEVGALPDDTPLFSGDYNDLTNKPTIPAEQIQSDWNQTNINSKDFIKNKPTIPTALSQLSEDSTHRVVSDVEKTTWNNKSNFSGSYNDLTDKPTIPDVPTNVSAFTNDVGYLTQHQSLSDYIQKSKTAGLIKNDGTIDTNTYLTQHQDISGKENVTTIVAPVDTTDATLPITTLTCEVGKYYRIDVAVDTLGITLPAMTDLTTVRTVVIYLTGGTTPAVTITSADSKDVYYQDGFEIKANSTYEINALFNGVAWIVAAAKINVE